MDSNFVDISEQLDALVNRIDEARGQFAEGDLGQVPIETRVALVRGLAEDISGLAKMVLPDKTTSDLTPGRFKELLADERHRIRLHDSLIGQVRVLRNQLDEENFPVFNVHNVNIQDYLTRVERYEALATPLLAIMAAGGYWADEERACLLGRCLGRLADPSDDRNGLVSLLNLRLYPALLLTYACGIGAVMAGRYTTLASLLVSSRTWKDNKQQPLVRALAQKDVIDGSILQHRPELERHKAPVSDHLFDLLREPLLTCAIDEGEYLRAFDRFEYLFALVYGDLSEQKSSAGHIWGPPGCFLWRRNILEEVEREIADQAEGWPPLRAGLFGGSVERVKHVKQQIDAIVHRSGW
jgi:hypothetical protein